MPHRNREFLRSRQEQLPLMVLICLFSSRAALSKVLNYVGEPPSPRNPPHHTFGDPVGSLPLPEILQDPEASPFSLLVGTTQVALTQHNLNLRDYPSCDVTTPPPRRMMRLPAVQTPPPTPPGGPALLSETAAENALPFSAVPNLPHNAAADSSGPLRTTGRKLEETRVTACPRWLLAVNAPLGLGVRPWWRRRPDSSVKRGPYFPPAVARPRIWAMQGLCVTAAVFLLAVAAPGRYKLTTGLLLLSPQADPATPTASQCFPDVCTMPSFRFLDPRDGTEWRVPELEFYASTH
ncbi:hypothetical protein SKAU_G00387910 [Synaphobranchus kaupii]|uniref:Uncharacterized protein n=1 Tax=Synaphobranchus kaupii TaxID=118154 RepID=A0A9Q1EAY2_SYNKA|nr:hypothetical protein SKAU_G00387910 [Synaphobranchus kaupii]